jgi:hypothetical protein
LTDVLVDRLRGLPDAFANMQAHSVRNPAILEPVRLILYNEHHSDVPNKATPRGHCQGLKHHHETYLFDDHATKIPPPGLEPGSLG